MNLLLRLKHWQLFALIFIPGVIFQFFVGSNQLAGWGKHTFLLLFAATTLWFATSVFCWFYALATGLHQHLPTTVSASLGRFKTALFVPSLYIALIIAGMAGMEVGTLSGMTASALLVIIPLHLLSMASIFYCLYFNAKSLKAAELQRPVVFADYLDEIFLFWFFPLGIWLIQPRVNALFRTEQPS